MADATGLLWKPRSVTPLGSWGAKVSVHCGFPVSKIYIIHYIISLRNLAVKKKKTILKYMTKELILHIIPDNISVLSLTLWEILI